MTAAVWSWPACPRSHDPSAHAAMDGEAVQRGHGARMSLFSLAVSPGGPVLSVPLGADHLLV